MVHYFSMKKLLFVFALTPLISFASVNDFVRGLSQDLKLTRFDRAYELSSKANVSVFNAYQRWRFPTAMAIYNPLTNTMSLPEDNLNGSNIKSAVVIRGDNYIYSRVATIFHEMGHAEMDIMIENEVTLSDSSVMNLYRYTMKDFYRKKFSAIRTWDYFQEHFGYYRTELVEFFYTELSDILLQNGWNRVRKGCFLNAPLRKLLQNGVSREDFLSLLNFSNDTEFYRQKINPRWIFIAGKDYDMENAPERDRASLIFWSYHQENYNFPINRKDFIKRLNKGHQYKKSLAECRGQLWDDYQAGLLQ